jgi:F420-0:gamma-glutamyl ligase-like protein
MSPSQVRTYSRSYNHHDNDAADFLEIIQKIPTLTKLGAVCLVTGKFMGVMAIMVAFIPALNVLVAPLVIAWGGFVFIAIVLCSTDHFRQKKQSRNKAELDSATQLITETELLDQEIIESSNDKPAVIIPLIVGQN